MPFDVVTPEEYVKWVQRALNRLFGCDLTLNGTPSEPYRYWVGTFQLSRGLPENGKVNEPTQDALIKANHFDPIYVMWLEKALTIVGAGKFNGNGIVDKADLKKSVLSFQSYQGLKADGWVGSKTEKYLINESKIAPPGDPSDPPKLVPPPKDYWIDRIPLENRFTRWTGAFLLWHTGLASSNSQKPKKDRLDVGDLKARACMLEKFKTRRGNFEFLRKGVVEAYVNTDKYKNKKPEQITSNALDELMEDVRVLRAYSKSEKAAYEAFQDRFNQLYKEIGMGLTHITVRHTILGDANKPIQECMKWLNAMEDKPFSLVRCYMKHAPGGASWSPGL